MSKLKVLVAIGAAIFFNSQAADTYDATKSTLTIPVVKVGETYYSNVVITLGNIVSVGSASAVYLSYDTYTLASNQLAIPQVTVGSTTYYNVVVTVGNVLSVGSICASLAACTSSSTSTDSIKPISGTAYIRDSNISFASNASGVGIANTTVTIAGVSGLTDGDGNFEVNVPLTVLANDKVTLTNAKYVPISIDRTLVDINPTYTNIAMYPVQTVQKKTGFITGVFTMDSGGFMPDVFSNNKFPSTYDRIVSSTSANLVAISDPAWVTRSDTVNNVVTMSATDSIPMYTLAQYTYIVNLAKARNLKFLMQIGVYPSNGVSLPWASQSKGYWDAWFAAYKPLVLKQTAIATALGIEYISLGMNHGFMSSVDVGYWQDLISAVRAAGYQGKLVYQALASPVSGAYNEASAFNFYSLNTSLTIQQKNYDFAQLFDYIVLDIYGVSSQVNGRNYISRDTIKSNVQNLLAGFNNYPVPLMVMIGTPSVQDGATTSDYIEPCLQCSSVANNHTVDLFAQADVYEAVLEAINDGSVANGHIAGILSWGYWYSDNYGLQDASVPDINSDGTLINYSGTIHAGAFNKSASIRGKPAESILKWWTNNLK